MILLDTNRCATRRVTGHPHRAHRSDPALVRACLRGDEQAWNRLVDQYGGLVYSVIRRYALGEADTDDAFQNVFLALHRHLGCLEDHTRLSAWLITIAHREAGSIARQAGRHRHLDERMVPYERPVDGNHDRTHREQLVHVALDLLGGRGRDLIMALFVGGATPRYAHVAEQLSMPVGSIGPTRARSVRSLERILLDLGIDGVQG